LRARHRTVVHRRFTSVPSAWWSCAQICAHIGVALLAAYGDLLLIRGWPWIGWALYPVAAFFIGSRMRCLGNMIHEASHGVLARESGANLAFGRLLAVLDFTSFEVYQRKHASHHRYVGDPERDEDFGPRQRYGFGAKGGSFLWPHVLRPLTLFHLREFVRPVIIAREDGLPVRLGRFVHVALLVCLVLAVGWLPFVLFYLVPYLTSYQVLRYWSDAADHAGIAREADEFDRVRNHRFSLQLLNRLVFPRNDEYHLVHHLFPWVATSHQGQLHELLMKDPVYAARDHGVRSLLRRSRRRT
jgi:fatty acid desaturase